MKELLLIPLILVLICMMGYVVYENESIKSTNEELRKKNYQYKQELNKMKKRWLTELAKNN